ncbi:MAG TPA: helix-turn-helix domain-containing protein [Casimicrobiaceae bacterium]
MLDLPLAAGSAPAERADAARNRAKILAAAEELIAERGIEHVSMDDVARRACVGKGTLYRRFGDRASLALALLQEHEAELQESLLRGAPPLGPGAPACERLGAFGDAYLDHLERHAPLIAAAEHGGRPNLAPYLAYRLHVMHLLREADPRCDADVLADALLATLSAPLFAHQRLVREIELERLKAAWHALVDGLAAVST